MMAMRYDGASTAVPAQRQKRVLGVQALLEWAFGRECARIETDPTARSTGQAPASFGTEYVILQRLALGGVKIDTSIGTSYPHEDAETVAAIVEHLPVALGGMRMALRIAEMARAGITPDWMPGAAPELVPVEWRRDNQFSRQEGRTVVGEIWIETLSVRHPKNPQRVISRTRRHEVRFTPCTWRPSVEQIDMVRREYVAWWTALARVRDQLQRTSLSAHLVSDAMPPRNPWKKPD